jgi:hypothetical protein
MLWGNVFAEYLDCIHLDWAATLLTLRGTEEVWSLNRILYVIQPNGCCSQRMPSDRNLNRTTELSCTEQLCFWLLEEVANPCDEDDETIGALTVIDLRILYSRAVRTEASGYAGHEIFIHRADQDWTLARMNGGKGRKNCDQRLRHCPQTEGTETITVVFDNYCVYFVVKSRVGK